MEHPGPEDDPLTVHSIVGMHRTLLQHLRHVESQGVLVQAKLDEIGTLSLHQALWSGSAPLDRESLERFFNKLIDLEASQRLMFEAGKRMFTQIMAYRQYLQSRNEEPQQQDYSEN